MTSFLGGNFFPTGSRNDSLLPFLFFGRDQWGMRLLANSAGWRTESKWRIGFRMRTARKRASIYSTGWWGRALLHLVLVVRPCPTLCDPMECSTPRFPVLHGLPEFAQALVHWVSDDIQPSHPLSPASSPAFNLSQHQGAKYWGFSISPSSEYSELVSFRIDWLDLLAV